MKNASRNRGFTFFEILVGFIIIGAIAVCAVPVLARTQRTYRLVAETNGIQARLRQARILAVTRNTDVRLRATSSTTYVTEEWSGSAWGTTGTFTVPSGFSVSASADPTFHYRGNANPVGTLTVTSPNSQTRQVIVESSGHVYAQ